MKSTADLDFQRNIFINCPFDPAYKALLRPLLFTILSVDLVPKIASERSDSGEQRIDKICELIESSQYGIHDLSRLKSQKKNELSRHNMPFELGIDYGSRKFGALHFREKKFLVLEKERFEFSKALSDLAGIDIKSHNDDPEDLIRAVRNWFVETIGLKNVTPPSVLWNDFNEFMADFDAERRRERFSEKDIYEMPVPEFIDHIRTWVEKKRNPIGPGLGSSAQIIKGKYQHTETTPAQHSLSNMSLSIVDGRIYRDDSGMLCADMQMQSPVADIQTIIEKSGGDREHFTSKATELSLDEANPTVFKAQSPLYYKKGDTLGGFILPADITYSISTVVYGHLEKRRFLGTFESDWKTNVPSADFSTKGVFEATLK